MSHYDSLYNQIITYWKPGVRDIYGKVSFDPPITLKGRWSDKSELFSDFLGQEIRSRSVVHVSIDVELGGYLYLGISSDPDPTSISNAYEIRAVERIPNIPANFTNIKAIL